MVPMLAIDLSCTQYYVLMVKCGSEIKAFDRLKEGGFDVVCPMFQFTRRIRHKKTDRLVVVKKPALDGYVFVNMESCKDIGILKDIEDVLKVVSFAGVPALIDDLDMERILYIVDIIQSSIMEEAMSPFLVSVESQVVKGDDLKIGDEVLITKGPIQTKGTYLGEDYVDAHIMGGTIKIKVNQAHITKIK